jgi:predicted Kef-type K+ transport protein
LLLELLLEMQAATEQARSQRVAQLLLPLRQAFVSRYVALLAVGLAANPPRLAGRVAVGAASRPRHATSSSASC